jgi:hypothetical protein
MKYKIQKSFYDLLQQLISEQNFKSFSIQPEHKGEVFYFEPENLEVDIDDLESKISDFIDSNSIDPAGTFYPNFTSEGLFLNAEFYADLKDLYCYGDNWEPSELYEAVNEMLIEELGADFIEDNIFIELDIEIQNKKITKLKSYLFDYRDDNGNTLADLSNHINLKNSILELVKEWVIDNCEEGEDPKYNIYFSLCESTVESFAIGHSETLTLELSDLN